MVKIKYFESEALHTLFENQKIIILEPGPSLYKKTLIHRCIIITKLSPQHHDDKTVIFIGQTSRHKLGDCEPQMRKSAQSYGKGVIKP